MESLGPTADHWFGTYVTVPDTLAPSYRPIAVNKAFSYLIQRLSVAIQQGKNATLVRGTLPFLTVDLFYYY